MLNNIIVFVISFEKCISENQCTTGKGILAGTGTGLLKLNLAGTGSTFDISNSVVLSIICNFQSTIL